MSLLSVIDRIASNPLDDFLSPVVDADTTTVLTVQNDIPYWLNVHEHMTEPGWFWLRPLTNEAPRMHCEVVHPAELHQMVEYLRQLPRFYVIALFPVSETAWAVSPFNISDAEQRGWAHGAPRVMHLVRHNLSAFDLVNARDLNGTLLYDNVSTRLQWQEYMLSMRASLERGDRKHVALSNFSLRSAYGAVHQMLENARKEQARRELEELRTTDRGRAQWHLEFMGAKLTDWRDMVNGYEVSWEYEVNGQMRTETIQLRRDLTIKSVGLCIARREGEHNLSSIVDVMRYARERGHDVRDYYNE